MVNSHLTQNGKPLQPHLICIVSNSSWTLHGTIIYHLSQTVSHPTRLHNILDLFFTNFPALIQNAQVTPGLSNHGIVMIESKIKHQLFFEKAANRKIPHYTIKQTGNLLQMACNYQNVMFVENLVRMQMLSIFGNIFMIVYKILYTHISHIRQKVTVITVGNCKTQKANPSKEQITPESQTWALKAFMIDLLV